MTENKNKVEHTLNRSINRVNGWTSLGVICFILILQPIIKLSWKSEHQRRYNKDTAFYCTLIGVYVVHAISQLIILALDYGWPSCKRCADMVLIGSLIFVITRVVTFAFILQRAKMAQGITPVVGPKWFSHYFPASIVLIWIIFSAALIIDRNNVEIICPKYGQHSYCEARYELHLQNTIKFILGGLTETFVSLVLLWLFVWPILKIKSSGVSQNKSRDAMVMTTLRWNIVMSIINLLTSLITIVGYSLIDGRFEYVLGIDRAFNVVTSFLMLGRNRTFLKSISRQLLQAFSIGLSSSSKSIKSGIIDRNPTFSKSITATVMNLGSVSKGKSFRGSDSLDPVSKQSTPHLRDMRLHTLHESPEHSLDGVRLQIEEIHKVSTSSRS